MIKRILVVSDTHGGRDILQKCINISAPFDMIIHCGDGVKDLRGADIPSGAEILAVAGNTDSYSSPDEETLLIENINSRYVMITHGHLYHVKSGLHKLSDSAAAMRADIVLFGHTHQSYLCMNNPVLFNPGDLSTGSYGIITIKDDDEWIFEQKKLKR